MDDIQFDAEVRQVKSKKLVSNDIEYSVVLTTSDPRLLQLAMLPSDITISVNIKPNDTG